MVFGLIEILDIAVTALALGYIFSHLIKAPKHYFAMLYENRYFNWDNIKYSMAVVAPAVVLHELGHKFASMAMGFPAAFYGIIGGGSFVLFGTIFGIVLRLIGSSFIFFIPGYVGPAYAGAWDGISATQISLLAFAGPVVNLALFLAFWWLLKSNKWPKYARLFWTSKQINLWLFIFNMLPIPPLDGSKVFLGLFKALGVF